MWKGQLNQGDPEQQDKKILSQLITFSGCSGCLGSPWCWKMVGKLIYECKYVCRGRKVVLHGNRGPLDIEGLTFNTPLMSSTFCLVKINCSKVHRHATLICVS